MENQKLMIQAVDTMRHIQTRYPHIYVSIDDDFHLELNLGRYVKHIYDFTNIDDRICAWLVEIRGAARGVVAAAERMLPKVEGIKVLPNA